MLIIHNRVMRTCILYTLVSVILIALYFISNYFGFPKTEIALIVAILSAILAIANFVSERNNIRRTRSRQTFLWAVVVTAVVMILLSGYLLYDSLLV